MDTYKIQPRFLINFFLLFSFAAASLLATTSSNAASPQAQEALANNPALEYAPDSVLVKFNQAASPAQKRNARALINAEKIRTYSLVQGLEHMQLGRGQSVEKVIEILQQLPFVEYSEPDYVLHTDTNDTYFYLQWGLHNTGQKIRYTYGNFDADIDAPEAWAITTGDPVFVVAVIDTGVEYNHEDLINNIWRNPGEIQNNNIDDDGNGYIDDIYGWDFFSNDNDPMDEEGHGTHVAGTICAEGNNGVGVSGVAWQCSIMALRFMGPDWGLTSDAIAALNYAVGKGVRVSNNSWGGGGYSQSLYNAIQNASNLVGHLFVAAAGNGGSDGIGDNTDISPYYPSSYDLDNIISVAATDNQDRLADFSNFGTTSVDLGAPGVDIVSTERSSYYWSSGTSMATPHVTGVAALIFDLNPNFTNTDVKDLILNTTRPIDALNGKTLTGGVVNAYAVLAGGESSTTTTLPPTTTTTTSSTTTTLPPTTTTTTSSTTTTLPPTTTTTTLPPSCSNIENKETCNANPACVWAGHPNSGTCQDVVVCNDQSCCDTFSSDKKLCEAAGSCTWNNRDKVCSYN